MGKSYLYHSRLYHIKIDELDNGTAYAEVQCQRIYKHGAYNWKRTHRKFIGQGINPFVSSHCLIDSTKDYIDYYDCLYRLKHSKCARRWFITILKPYVEKFF